GQWAAAVFHLDRLLTAEPDRHDWLRQRAEAQGRRGRTAAAVADLARVLDRGSDAADRLQIIRLHAEGGRWADALAACRVAAERRHGLAALAWQALSHIQLGQLAEAEQALRELRTHGVDDHLHIVRDPWGRDPQNLWSARHELAPLLSALAQALSDPREEARRRALL